MIKTFFGAGALDTSWAFLAALVIGVLFGAALERAGFGSSRRLTGVFYFTDMAVLKVMFSAMITAMLGLGFARAAGLLSPADLYFMPTIYGAQIVGGLIFGVGFVMGGWCPGTAAVGVASGKLDALVVLGGTIIGSIIFNEAFPVIRPLYTWGQQGVVFIYQTLGMSPGAFSLLLTLVAVACFWGAEALEPPQQGSRRFLTYFSLSLAGVAGVLFLVWGAGPETTGSGPEAALMAQVEAAQDHMEPEELADRLLRGDPDLLVVDIRPAAEYQAFHLRGAVHIPLNQLAEALAPHRNRGLIVLYSNGMTHPAQARDSLVRQGYRNVYLLTDGLQGFRERCLKPVSLRDEPLPPDAAARVRAWREYFGKAPGPAAASAAPLAMPRPDQLPAPLPGLVEPDWLARNLGQPWLKIIDLRPQPDYSSGHIPGSLRLDMESLRGLVHGVPSMLLPAPLLAAHFSLLGLHPSDLVVFVTGDKFHDGTLAGLAGERLGHTRYAVLQGGMAGWRAGKRPLDTALPPVTPSQYPAKNQDDFTLDYREVLKQAQGKTAVILDVRPKEYFTGEKSDEARAGHIPGAVNRPYTEDVVKTDREIRLKPLDELARAYAKLLPSKETAVIVHCRTGHQASQTVFVLKRLLGYKKVQYYDAGWTEWAARPELPVTPEKPKAAKP
jgi:thiosulfate/3-mercaptopyruvate sulfurtransferase